MSDVNGQISPPDPLVIRLSAVIDRFREGAVDAFAARTEIYDSIADAGVIDHELDKNAVAAVYLSQIDEIERIAAGAANRGEAGSPTTSSRQVSPQGLGTPGRTQSRRGGKKRSRRRTGDSQSSSESDSESTGSGRPSKRSRARQDPSKFAFAKSSASQFLDSITLGDNCRKTRDLAGVYALDPKRALWALKYDGMGTPPPLPDAEWSRVLANRPVNLDSINTGAFSSEIDDKIVHKMGELSISTSSSSRTSKPISSGLEWYHAFDIASDAIVYAYPHRKFELRVYREYIQSLFSALQAQHHGAIITLDKAIRRHVSECPNLELSSIGQFTALQMAHLTPSGIGSSRASTNAQTKGRGSDAGGRDEICRQWNSSQCSRRQCKFKHVCDFPVNGEYCRGSHRRSECSKKN